MNRARAALLAALMSSACESLNAPSPGRSAPQQRAERAKRTLGDFSLSNSEEPEAFAGAPAGEASRAAGAPALQALKRRADAPAAAPAPEPEQKPSAAPARAWFPETFLFDPLVVTDDQGSAEVAARVPDRLTTWRVLALAHSREGGQAGVVARFSGSLPAYVDPVVPLFLFAGDRVRLPIQVVNTTAAPLAEQLALEVQGARGASAVLKVNVPAGGSALEFFEVRAERPGRAVLRASLGSTDAVLRSFPIHPSGRPLEIRRGGTLAAPRTIELEGPASLDPDGSRLTLSVYPGALAILRSELTAASAREGAAADAYALLLAGSAPKLLEALGETPDRDAVRAVALVAGQRAVRHGRSPSLETATLLAEAALAHPDNPILSRLGQRLAQQVASGQRPDGTFSGGEGWTLQRLLVATADALRAVRAAPPEAASRARAAAATVKASGAFERNLGRIADGYTAAAVAASGAVSGPLLERLRAQVRKAVVAEADGSRRLPPPEGAVRADGTAPTTAEATALAALALEGDPEAPWRADLGAALLADYSPGSGWGDGRTNLAALRAVLSLFRAPIPPGARIALSLDGAVVAQGVLDTEHLRDVLVLSASGAGAAGRHVLRVEAEPPLPGLGFSLTLRAFVPWKEEREQGLQLAAQLPPQMRVGEAVEVALAAAAPAGAPMRLRHALPASVQPDRRSLEALRAEGAVQDFRVEEGEVVLEIGPRSPGQAFAARYRAVPTLAGLLHSGPSSLELPGRPGAVHLVPPSTWDVR